MGFHGNLFPTFDAESKFAKIPNSHVKGGWGFMETNFQLLMPSPNLLKSQILMLRVGGVLWKPISNFWCWVQICYVCYVGGGGGFVETNFQKSTSNFLSPVLNWNFHFVGWGVGGQLQQSQLQNFKVNSWASNVFFQRDFKYFVNDYTFASSMMKCTCIRPHDCCSLGWKASEENIQQFFAK